MYVVSAGLTLYWYLSNRQDSMTRGHAAAGTPESTIASLMTAPHTKVTIHGVEFESRYQGYIAEESFITNFPYTPVVATNLVSSYERDWTHNDYWMRNRHWFVTGFYHCPSRYTKAFQKLNELLRGEDVPWDPFAYGIIFNKLNEAAMFRRLNKQNPENERFRKLLDRAEKLENTIYITLTNEEFWLDGPPVTREKALELQRIIRENLPYDQFFGDFHHIPFDTGHRGFSSYYALVK